MRQSLENMCSHHPSTKANLKHIISYPSQWLPFIPLISLFGRTIYGFMRAPDKYFSFTFVMIVMVLPQALKSHFWSQINLKLESAAAEVWIGGYTHKAATPQRHCKNKRNLLQKHPVEAFVEQVFISWLHQDPTTN